MAKDWLSRTGQSLRTHWAGPSLSAEVWARGLAEDGPDAWNGVQLTPCPCAPSLMVTHKKETLYGLTARMEPHDNFTVRTDQFLQKTENKDRLEACCSYTESFLKHPFPQYCDPPPKPQSLVSSVSQACCLCLCFFLLLPQNKTPIQSRHAKEPLKSTVGKSDPCWMTEDKPAWRWPRRRKMF